MIKARSSDSDFRYGSVVTCADLDENRLSHKGGPPGWSKATQKFSNDLASHATLRRMLVRFIALPPHPSPERRA